MVSIWLYHCGIHNAYSKLTIDLSRDYSLQSDQHIHHIQKKWLFAKAELIRINIILSFSGFTEIGRFGRTKIPKANTLGYWKRFSSIRHPDMGYTPLPAFEETRLQKLSILNEPEIPPNDRNTSNRCSKSSIGRYDYPASFNGQKNLLPFIETAISGSSRSVSKRWTISGQTEA